MDESQAAEQASQAAQSVDLSSLQLDVSSIASELDGFGALVQSQNDNVNTLISGLVTVQMFSLLAQLLTLGVLLVVVFVVTLRRF